MTNPKEDIEIFANHCVFMRSVYLHCKILFEDSTADEKQSMSRTANVLFGDLNRILIEHITLEVCKITDGAKDVRGNDNLTIAFLLQHYGLKEQRLEELHEKLRAFRVKLLPARNKFISHSDRNAIIAGFALGAATSSEWNEFWLDLQELVRIIHGKVIGGAPLYINGVAGLSDAHGLLKALKHSDCFDKLLGDSDPDIRRKCLALALD